MPPLRLERECKERTNSATIDYRCVEFDRREPTESVAERLPQVNPCDWTTKKVSVVDAKCSSLRASAGCVAIQSTHTAPSCHAELVSASVPCCALPVTLDRSRNRLARLAKNGTAKSMVFALCLRSLAQFGMTLKEMTLVCGFTMAEILLSLTIIGVVAAITLPSLTGNINERTWNTQRKALYARMSQAIALMPSLNGYGTVSEGDSSTSAVDTAAETFVTNGLAKVLKINNICDSEHLEDCGIPSKFTTFAGSTISSFPKTIREFNPAFYASDIVDNNGNSYSYLSQLDTVAAAFETANGESIVAYYNPYCSAKMDEQSSYYTQPKMCANLVYDLNGTKGPNTVGKDMGFITILYPSDPVVVAPVLVYNSPDSVTYNEASKICRERDSESRLSNLEEAISLSYNRALLGENLDGAYWTSTMLEKSGEIRVWRMYFAAAQVHPDPRHYGHQVMCVKR